MVTTGYFYILLSQMREELRHVAKISFYSPSGFIDGF